MRKLILPLIIVLVCSSVSGFSQGASCANPHVLPTGSTFFCNNYAMGPLGATAAFNAATGQGCNFTNGRRVTWFIYTPATTILAASFTITLDVAADLQATLYDPGVTTCAFNVNTTANSAMCAAVGLGGTGVLMPNGATMMVAGRPYYIRVYANINDNAAHTINLCFNPVVINDVPVTVGSPCTNYPVGDLGTGSIYSPLPSGTNRCGGSAGWNNNNRVTWFRFVPTTTLTCATFNINVDVPVKTEVAFYNTAGAYQSASTLCMPLGSGVWAPALPFTMTAGQPYYLRVYTAIADALPHSINICATPFIQPNDLCNSATRIDNTGIQDNNVCATGSGATSPPFEPAWVTSNSNTLLCAPALQNTAWYYFLVNDNTITTTVNVSGISCSNYGGGGIGAGGAGIQMGLLQGVPTIPNCTTNNGLIVPPNYVSNHCFQTTATSFAFNVTPGPTVQNGTKMYIAVDGYSGANCSYTISTLNAIPIPVRIKYFSVFKMAESNQVRWITSWETNNRNFEVERSYDGSHFNVIGTLDGSGTSSADIQYKFDDTNPPAIAYYRLKQIDIDGKFEYSNVIQIKRDNTKPIFNVSFANPVHGSAVVTINTERAGTSTVRIVDVSGKDLSTQVVPCGRGNNTVLQDFSRLAAGNYYMVVTQDDLRVVKPFVKQ